MLNEANRLIWNTSCCALTSYIRCRCTGGVSASVFDGTRSVHRQNQRRTVEPISSTNVVRIRIARGLAAGLIGLICLAQPVFAQAEPGSSGDPPESVWLRLG